MNKPPLTTPHIAGSFFGLEDNGRSFGEIKITQDQPLRYACRGSFERSAPDLLDATD
jgi:hypothetical protein